MTVSNVIDYVTGARTWKDVDGDGAADEVLKMMDGPFDFMFADMADVSELYF